MKTKYLLFLFLFAASTAIHAQLKFESYDILEARQLADSIALNAKYPFVFVEEGIEKANRNYCFKYINKNDESEKLTVFFHVIMEGRNVDLEIEGTPKYEFNVVYGRFLNIFPFWKKFIDPDADAVKITTGSNFHNFQKGKHKFILQRVKETWSLKMF